ncbi:MAG: DegT/DnrJ/EryC1/StrS family aminotransferase [Gaiellaceae bacterium]
MENPFDSSGPRNCRRGPSTITSRRTSSIDACALLHRQFHRVNRSRYGLFRSEMHCVRGIHVVEFPALERSNYHFVAIEVDARGAGVDRDGLLDFLLTENVLARPYFSPPCHLAAAYSDVPVHGLDETERLSRCTFRSAVEPTRRRSPFYVLRTP